MSGRRTPPPSRRPRGTVERKGGRIAKRLTVYMPPDLAKRLRIKCIEDETNMSDVIARLVERHLGERR